MTEAAARVKVAAIVGPTAAGKSEVAVVVAEQLGAEIVSVDSMQIYRGLDAGTAKPSAGLRGRVPHHLIDVLDPSHGLTVAEYQGLARAAVADIAARGNLPLLVGGAGLYFRAVVDDLEFPPHAGPVRSRVEDLGRRLGHEGLHARLRELDPVAAERIDGRNVRRIVRALEVIELTGRRFSDSDRMHEYRSIYDLAAAGLTRSRDALHQRIEARVDEMLVRGLSAEARDLAGRGLGATARQALGYRQVLEAPAAGREELRELIIVATRRYARRQESWFRSDPRIQWFGAGRADLAARLVDHFTAELELP
jgi:tRNA dimethylallyltransferase